MTNLLERSGGFRQRLLSWWLTADDGGRRCLTLVRFHRGSADSCSSLECGAVAGVIGGLFVYVDVIWRCSRRCKEITGPFGRSNICQTSMLGCGGLKRPMCLGGIVCPSAARLLFGGCAFSARHAGGLWRCVLGNEVGGSEVVR